MTLIDANPVGLHALPGVVTHVVTVPGYLVEIEAVARVPLA